MEKQPNMSHYIRFLSSVTRIFAKNRHHTVKRGLVWMEIRNNIPQDVYFAKKCFHSNSVDFIFSWNYYNFPGMAAHLYGAEGIRCYMHTLLYRVRVKIATLTRWLTFWRQYFLVFQLRVLCGIHCISMPISLGFIPRAAKDLMSYDRDAKSCVWYSNRPCHTEELVSHPYVIDVLLLCHTDDMFSLTHEIAKDLMSYGRVNKSYIWDSNSCDLIVTTSSVWDSMMLENNMGWSFYATENMLNIRQ